MAQGQYLADLAIMRHEVRFGLPEGPLRGHTFHYSKSETALVPLVRAVAKRGGVPGEAVYREGRLTASYVHLYFASNPEAAARLFLPD